MIKYCFSKSLALIFHSSYLNHTLYSKSKKEVNNGRCKFRDEMEAVAKMLKLVGKTKQNRTEQNEIYRFYKFGSNFSHAVFTHF